MACAACATGATSPRASSSSSARRWGSSRRRRWGRAGRGGGRARASPAAQAVGEPGTQLTMRTFHTGGVAGEDITQGLPRVEELFEARIPKGQATMTEIDGTVEVPPTSGDQPIAVRVTHRESYDTSFKL